MSSINTIVLDKVVDPGIKKHFVDGYKQLKPKIDLIFKTDKQTSLNDVYQNYTGIGQVSQVNEGGTYNEDSPIQAFGVTMTPVKYGKLIPITYEIEKWSKTKEIFDAANMLGKATARHIEKNGASILNNSQNTSYTSYTDNKPLGSTQHTRADGGSSQSNASSTGIILSDDNLETALLAMEYQLDDRGEPIDMMASRLIIPPHLRKQALIITKSEKQSNTNDNNINVYNSMQQFYGTMEVLVWYYLGGPAGGSNTRWFLEDQTQSKLMWNWADKPQVKRDDSVGFKQDVVYFKGFYYAAKGWGDWRGMWVSAGDLQAYSN